MRFHLLNATFAQLQHGQVVVSLSMVVIKRQRKFETLIGQRQVCYTLQTLNTSQLVSVSVCWKSIFHFICATPIADYITLED